MQMQNSNYILIKDLVSLQERAGAQGRGIFDKTVPICHTINTVSRRINGKTKEIVINPHSFSRYWARLRWSCRIRNLIFSSSFPGLALALSRDRRSDSRRPSFSLFTLISISSICWKFNTTGSPLGTVRDTGQRISMFWTGIENEKSHWVSKHYVHRFPIKYGYGNIMNNEIHNFGDASIKWKRSN